LQFLLRFHNNRPVKQKHLYIKKLEGSEV